MSITRELAEWQHKAGLADKPSHVLEAEQTAAMDADAFGAHAWSAFRAGYGNDRPEAQVLATAQAVMADWRRSGREVKLDRDTAEELAAATGNAISGAGAGIRMLAGSSPGDAERPEDGLAEALAAQQKEMGLLR